MSRDEALQYLREKVDWYEPVFILRAKDVLAVPTIFKWVDLAKDFQVNPDKINSAVAVAGSFLNYIGTKGVPD